MALADMTGYLNKHGRKVHFDSQLEGTQLTMVNKMWWQGSEAAGHVISTAGKQR